MNWQQVVFEQSFGTARQLPVSDLPEICFSGRSNVGKSSLINRIIGRKSLARVSSKPGKTVTVNFYRLPECRLVDLPGYGYAKVPFAEKDRWSELMETYFRSGRRIVRVFQLMDMRHPPTEFDRVMLDFLRQSGIPYTVVLTKCDKLNKTEFAARLSAVPTELGVLAQGGCVIPFSALSGEGIEQIRARAEKDLSF